MEQMKFIGFRDFYKRRKHIKTQYAKMPLKHKYYFKWFIYSNLLLDETTNDLIWMYLNEDLSENKLKKHYRKARI